MATDTINRLRALVAAGYASEAEQRELEELTSSTTPRAPQRGRARATTPASTPAPPQRDGVEGGDDDAIFVSLNTDSFESGGGGNFMPPAAGEGIYPARCLGTMVPTQADDQLWFLFEGTVEPFNGALVTAALTREGERSGAFKVKDVLVALEVPYEVYPGNGVQFSKAALLAATCQVEYAYYQDSQGKRSLRINNVYPVNQPIESL